MWVLLSNLKTVKTHKYLIFALILGFWSISSSAAAEESLIIDGGFENGPGSDSTAWTQWSDQDTESEVESIIMPDEISGWDIPAYQCKSAFWAGGNYEKDEDKTVPLSNYITQQGIKVTEETLGLGFSTCFNRTDEDDSIPDDFFYVSIEKDETENVELNKEMTRENNTYPEWKHHIIDMSTYANETVTLRIGAKSGSVTEFTGNVLVDAVNLYEGKQQSVSDVNANSYDNQAYTDDHMKGMDIFLADDFTLLDIDSMYYEIYGIKIHGSLDNADSVRFDDDVTLHFEIYKDGSGAPNGNPKDPDKNPLWALSLPANDPQIDISVDGGDVSFYPRTPINLAAGIYWLVFYPEMSEAVFGQYGWRVSDTLNGFPAMVINPDGENDVPDQWTPITSINDWGLGQQDLAFTIYFQKAGRPDIDISANSLEENLTENETSTTGFIIANSGDGALEIISIESAAEWISIYPEKGAVEKSCGEMDVAVTFNATGKDAGTYRDVIEITSTDPDDDTIDIPVEMTVTEEENDSLSRGTIQFSSSSYTVGENEGQKKVKITRSGGSDGAVGVAYQTVDATAVSRLDYEHASGQLSWLDDDSSPKEITISIKNDEDMEGSEYIRLVLSNPTGGVSLGNPNTAVLTINDDKSDGNNDSDQNNDFDTDANRNLTPSQSGCFINTLISNQ